MFRKNKKIFKFLIGALILSLPATLKVSAMENNPENLETNVEATQKEFDFSDDEEFNLIFKDRLNHILTINFVEDLKKYMLCYSECIKTLNSNSKFLNNTYYKKSKLKNLFVDIIENYIKEHEKFIKQNIEKAKNKKINFHFYEHFLNYFYLFLMHNTKEFLSNKNIMNYDFSKEEIKICDNNQNINYEKIADYIIENKDYIFKEISEFIKKEMHETGNEKFYNIPEKYNSFKEYYEYEKYIRNLETSNYLENKSNLYYVHEKARKIITSGKFCDAISKTLGKLLKDLGYYETKNIEDTSDSMKNKGSKSIIL